MVVMVTYSFFSIRIRHSLTHIVYKRYPAASNKHYITSTRFEKQNINIIGQDPN